MSHSAENDDRAMKIEIKLLRRTIIAAAAALSALFGALALAENPHSWWQQMGSSTAPAKEDAAKAATRAMTFTQRPEVAK
ncbi:hypothetical protein NLM33_48435 (plasmid) [Bradyrhizobium sp. CCGUVB1N3]|uniref:hypothetical protein n=1 Tax=Bradyrhizobium sp. CCGUVB1N3 TaxID=2949629 RepID=UPI0020B37DD4|nr:hypothetical protein [Bradyrhizobium sp. CCGUVB1N3]MCP3477910.1 hypothetical protein [Bradyrhizobium sp. CCGUVB1N3]